MKHPASGSRAWSAPRRLARLIAASLLLLGATADGRPAARSAKRKRATATATTTTTAGPGSATGSEIAAPPSANAGVAEPAADDRREANAAATPSPASAPVSAPRSRSAAVVASNDTPAGDAKETAAPVAAAPTSSGDLEKLRADYDRLRDDLFRARSRAQIVEDALWKSKLSATFRWKGAPSYVVHHATVRLDGGEIWDSGDKAVTDDLVTVAERPVKPGPHAVTLRLEIRPVKKSKDSDKLGYTSEHTFAIIVPDGKRTHVSITGDEDGNAPEYEPEIEVQLESEK